MSSCGFLGSRGQYRNEESALAKWYIVMEEGRFLEMYLGYIVNNRACDDLLKAKWGR